LRHTFLDFCCIRGEKRTSACKEKTVMLIGFTGLHTEKGEFLLTVI